MALDAFTISKSVESGNQIYTGYMSKYPGRTMILYSLTGDPLAALMLKTDTAEAVLTARPSPQDDPIPYFQGLINKAGQKFEFIICNLSATGSINFNILRSKYKVNERDPGPTYGINQVNELRPNECYTVRADQKFGRAMILNGLEKANKSVSVGQAEDEAKNTNTQKDGIYFHLSVVGCLDNQAMVAKFASGTKWQCSDHFIRCSPKPVAQPYPQHVPYFGSRDYGSRSRDYGSRDFGSRSEGEGANARMNANEITSALAGAARAQGLQPTSQAMMMFGARPDRSADAEAFTRWRADQAVAGAARSRHPEPEEAMEVENGNVDLFDDAPRESAPRVASPLTHPNQLSSEVLEIMVEQMERDKQLGRELMDRRKMGTKAKMKGATSISESGAVACVDVGSADYDDDWDCGEDDAGESAAPKSKPLDLHQVQAGVVAYGDAVVVKSVETNTVYDFDHTSEPTVLCLGIYPEMSLRPCDRVQALEDTIRDAVENGNKVMLASLARIYDNYTECVIDLESPADTVIIQCGHKCINHANTGGIKKCPICRGHVIAFVSPHFALRLRNI